MTIVVTLYTPVIMHWLLCDSIPLHHHESPPESELLSVFFNRQVDKRTE